MDFPGPPKPSRAALPTLVNLSERLGSADVDSLPALADEVAQGQKHQLAELQSRLNYLEQIKAEYVKAQKKIGVVKDDIRKVERQIFLTEDEIDSKGKTIQEMQRNIDDYVESTEALKLKHIRLKSKLTQDRGLYENYRQKMTYFKSNVDRFYEDSEVSRAIKESQMEIETVSRKIEKFGMMEERERMLNGEIHREMEKNIQSLIEQEEAIKIELKSLDNLTREENEKRLKIKQGTEVMQKRNAAQMTRIKRQLQEGSTRTRNLDEEISNLESRIKQMRSSV